MGDFPEDVRHFIEDHIDSIELLHVLLLLRENPDREWTIEDLSNELRSSPYSIGRRLDRLRRSRLVTAREQAFRYAAGSTIDTVVQRLLEMYRDRRTTVIDLIFASPPDPLRSFSRAFKIRGRDRDR